MKKTFLIFIMMPLFFLTLLPVTAAEKDGHRWQDETMYYLTVDRFNNGANSNDTDIDTRDPYAYHGGDFEGIILQLDYLKDMGFTTIILAPIFDNLENGYHGYFINDLYKPDEHFGSMDDFKKLVKEAHDRDMKIILDFVVNHVAPNHPWLTDSAKEDWFHSEKEIENWNDKAEVETGWLNGLPDLNQDHPEVRSYLLDAAKWWIKESDIDGYHLIDAQHVPADFWSDFSKEVKSVKENLYLLGDISTADSTQMAEYLHTGIDGFADYSSNGLLRAALSETDQSFKELFTVLNENETTFKEPALLGKFVDNHKMARFTEEPIAKNVHPGSRWRLAFSYLYTTPGIPIVFYGSEIALAGGEPPDNFQQMNFLTDTELIDYLTQLGDVRGMFPSLKRGSFELLYEQGGMAVFKREYQEETTVVAINNTSKTQDVPLTVEQLAENKELRGMLAGDLIRSENGEYNLVIDREEAEIYLLTDETGLNIPYLIAMLTVIVLFILFIILLKRRSKNRTPQ